MAVCYHIYYLIEVIKTMEQIFDVIVVGGRWEPRSAAARIGAPFITMSKH
jgi:hypothetical protein